MPGFVGTELPAWVADLLREGLGGVCIFGHNVDTPQQVAALTAAIYDANPHAIVSIDEEGGDVSRLYQHEGSPFPGNAVLGRLHDVEATRAVARQVGAELAEVGIHFTLAPDADVNSNPLNPVIGVRSFGSDPAEVAEHTAAWTEGVQAAGVAACAKHFPGHGDTSSDSHVSEPVVTADAATLAVREFVPFRAAIGAGTKTVMTSHIRVPALDEQNVATFSPTILGDVLRGQLGFDGVIVTDALDMVGACGEIGIPAAAVRAIGAGADLLCLGSNNPHDEILAVVEALTAADAGGDIPAGRLADAADRCMGLADWLSDARRDGLPGHVASRDDEAAPVIPAADVAATFAISDRARALLAASTGAVRWVSIEPERNIAVGATPFGPFFAGGAQPTLTVPVDDRGVAADYTAEPGVLTVVVGRELHRDQAAMEAAATIAARSEAIVVDMGFARPELVDIATFGASRLVGKALIELTERA